MSKSEAILFTLDGKAERQRLCEMEKHIVCEKNDVKEYELVEHEGNATSNKINIGIIG